MARVAARLALSLAGALLAAVAADEHIVLKPVYTDPALPEKMLVFMPGGAVPNANYEATALAIQQSTVGVRLWVAIPAVFKRLCIISCTTLLLCGPLHQAVEAALDQAKAQGWTRGDDSKDMWLAGHSLGGICSNTLFQAYTKGSSYPFAGLIIMGSYVDRTGAHDLTNYPVPVFMLAGELDFGQARPGKLNLWWQQHLEVAKTHGEDYAVLTKPVTVLPKLNHSNFCPGFDVPGDLPAEVDEKAATQTIGSVVGSWLQAQTPQVPAAARQVALQQLRDLLAYTRQVLAPVQRALDAEAAEGSSALCVAAQHAVAGLPSTEDGKLDATDTYQSSGIDFAFCNAGWAKEGSADLKTSSCSHADYDTDLANTGNFISAKQVACKLVAADRVAEELGVPAPAANLGCKEANQRAVALAESLAPQDSLKRYKSKGRSFCFQEDKPSTSLTFSESLDLKETAACLSITSPVQLTPLDSSKSSSGTQSCKVISPARALDWIMTDSLKPYKGLSEEVMV